MQEETSVAASNLSGEIYGVRPGRPAWMQPRQVGDCASAIPGTTLSPPGPRASVASCEPQRCDCSREGDGIKQAPGGLQ